MKKIVTLIFCVMLILAMAGCGQSPKAADKATSTQQDIIDKANKAPEKQEFTPVTEVQEGRKNVYVVLKNVTSGSNADTSNPKTGDTAMIGTAAIVMALATVGMGTAFYMKKKELF